MYLEDFFKTYRVGKSTLYSALTKLEIKPTKKVIGGRKKITFSDDEKVRILNYLEIYTTKINGREAQVRVRKWL